MTTTSDEKKKPRSKKKSPMVEPRKGEAVQYFDVGQIDDNPWQPRKHYDEETVRDIATSIREGGLQQFPAGRMVDERVQLAFGMTRLRAFRQLAVKDSSFHELPVIIRDYSDEGMAFAALDENLARKDLTPIEEARAYKTIIDTFEAIGPTELGKRVGKNKSTISYAVSTLSLPEAVLEMGDEMGLALATLRELLPLQSKDHAHETMMIALLAVMKEAGDTTRDKLIEYMRAAFNSRYSREQLPEQFMTLEKDIYNGVKFDPNEFEKAHRGFVHQIPNSGAFTCDVEEWAEWQRVANRKIESEGKKAPKVQSVASAVTLAKSDEPPPAEEPVDYVGEARSGRFDIECIYENCMTTHQEAPFDEEGNRVFESTDPLDAILKHSAQAHGIHEDLLKTAIWEHDLEEDDDWVCSLDGEKQWLVVQPSSKEERRRDMEARNTPPSLSLESFTALVPLPTKAPTMGNKVLTGDFDFKAQQESLAKLLELLAEANDVSDVLRDHAALVASALGSRANILDRSALEFGSYETLSPFTMKELKDPEECVRRCTWGYALLPSTAYGKENPFGLDAVCVNIKCVRGKKRAVTAEKSKEGKEGIEREKAQMEAAAKEIATRGTMNIGKVECLLLLHSLATGYVYAGTGMVYWQDTLAASLDLGRIGRGNVVDDNLKKVLAEKSEEELRYLVAFMLFERMRDQNKPQDWKPMLEPVFDLLGVESVLSAGEIEMGEPGEAAPAE